VTVTHNTALNRYEMRTEHGLAIAVYHQHGDRRVFTHTEVPPADEGKGYASQLVKEARAGPASGSSRPAASWWRMCAATPNIAIELKLGLMRAVVPVRALPKHALGTGQGHVTAAQQGHQRAPGLDIGETAILEPQLEILDRHFRAVAAGEDRDLVEQGAFCIG
jgi:hypothetical protein